MDMLDRTEKQKVVSSTILSGAIITTLVMIVCLLVAATNIGGGNAAITKNAVFGPIGLFEITKRPLSGGGFEGSIRLLPGQIVFWTIAILVISSVLWIRTKKTKSRTS